MTFNKRGPLFLSFPRSKCDFWVFKVLLKIAYKVPLIFPLGLGNTTFFDSLSFSRQTWRASVRRRSVRKHVVTATESGRKRKARRRHRQRGGRQRRGGKRAVNKWKKNDSTGENCLIDFLWVVTSRDNVLIFKSQKHPVQYNKQYHRKVLLISFYLSGHTLGFHPQNQKLEPDYTV